VFRLEQESVTESRLVSTALNNIQHDATVCHSFIAPEIDAIMLY